MNREVQAGGRFSKNWNLIAVLGPTASGKTTLAVRLARKIGGEIISADSRQVYRGMDLGTGKDLSEYGRNEDAVPFHLIDICDPTEEFSVFTFQQRFIDCFRDIASRGKMPFLVGGTGPRPAGAAQGRYQPRGPVRGASVAQDRHAGR